MKNGHKCMFIIGIILLGTIGYAQEHVYIAPMTLPEVIDAIAEYDVRHIDVPLSFPYYGITVFDEKKIFVVNQTDLYQRRCTTIHEIAHVVLRTRGLPYSDESGYPRVMSDYECDRLFGPQPTGQNGPDN